MKLSTLLALAIATVGYNSRVRAQNLEWVRQLGTSETDWSDGISADSLGNVYISGTTTGDLAAPNPTGIYDAFLGKYDSGGTLIWTRQLGSVDDDGSYSVAADSFGNAYIAGYTYGNLAGTSAGYADALLSKYDANGSLLWTRQLGTTGGDQANAVSTDGMGNVYITGNFSWDPGGISFDAFLSKYDSAGNLQWTRQFGTDQFDSAQDCFTDALGNTFVAGGTWGDLEAVNTGESDAFLRKYDPDGNLQWAKQFGTSGVDFINGVHADVLGNIYVAGSTEGSLAGANAGEADAFLRKYDAAGSLQWTRQLGNASADHAHAVSSDGQGKVYISGITTGGLGGRDAFVGQFDSDGALLWTRYFGTDRGDGSYDLTTDAMGNVYFSGNTHGDWGGPNFGDNDAFVAKLTVVPEPGSLLLAALAGAGLVWRRGRPRCDLRSDETKESGR